MFKMVDWFSQPRTFTRADDYPLNLDTSLRFLGDPMRANPVPCPMPYRGRGFSNPFNPVIAAMNYYAKPATNVNPGGYQMPPLALQVEFPFPKVR